MKLNIEQVERKLNKRIRRNCISVGFDVAERLTGISILKINDKYITMEHLEVIITNPKEDTFHRVDKFIDSLTKFKQLLNKYKGFKILVIEKCYFGKNPQTLINLAQFGILVYRELKKDFDTYHYIGATTARMIIGFNQKRQEKLNNIKAHIITRGKNKGKKKPIKCKELVHDYLKTDFNIIINDPDEADAFVLALAGCIL